MQLEAIPRPTTPRVPPVGTAELTDEQRRMTVGASAVIQTLARRDELLSAWITFGGRLLADSPLDGRQRELVVLRVALRTRCAYEWANHAVAAQTVGLSADDVRAVADGSTRWSGSDAALLDAVDELCAHDAISDGTWQALRRHRDDGALLSLLVLIGFYRMTAGLLNGVGVQPEAGRPPLGEPFEAEAPAPPATAPSVPAGPARVTGTWAVTFRHPAGDQRLTLELAERDGVLTGTVTNPAIGLAVPVRDGRADDGHVTATTHLTTPFEMTLGWDGTVVGDTIGGRITIPGAGSYPFDGTRSG